MSKNEWRQSVTGIKEMRKLLAKAHSYSINVSVIQHGTHDTTPLNIYTINISDSSYFVPLL